jgi:hypothetical protein
VLVCRLPTTATSSPFFDIFFTFISQQRVPPSFGNSFAFVWQILYLRLANSSPSFGNSFAFIWLHEISEFSIWPTSARSTNQTNSQSALQRYVPHNSRGLRTRGASFVYCC